MVSPGPAKSITNPAVVSIGKPAAAHQTPVYAWQMENGNGKQLVRKDSPEMVLNFTGKNTKLI